MNRIQNATWRDVGVAFVLDSLEFQSSYGKYEKAQIRYYLPTERNRLEGALNQLQEVITSSRKQEKIWLELADEMGQLKDIKGLVESLSPTGILDEVAIFAIKQFAYVSQRIHNIYGKLGMPGKITMESMGPIIEELSPKGQITATFAVYDSYNEGLKRVRKKKLQIEKAIYACPDPIKQQGLKEERLGYVKEEEEIVTKVLKRLSGLIYGHKGMLEHNIQAIGALDFLYAKAQLTIKHGGCYPKIGEELLLDTKEAYHLEVSYYLQQKGRAFVPISLEMEQGVTVLTGANMGGKSVALKTIMQNMMLVHMGFFPFAKAWSSPLFYGLYYISDELQSVSRGLSTFGAEILSINQMTEHMEEASCFAILDEFARGTNPSEGAILLRALSGYLHEKESMTLLATHYDDITREGMRHYQVIGLGSMDRERLEGLLHSHEPSRAIHLIQEQMDFRLERVEGQGDVPKEAITIAELLGLHGDIVKRASVLRERMYRGEQEESR